MHITYTGHISITSFSFTNKGKFLWQTYPTQTIPTQHDHQDLLQANILPHSTRYSGDKTYLTQVKLPMHHNSCDYRVLSTFIGKVSCLIIVNSILNYWQNKSARWLCNQLTMSLNLLFQYHFIISIVIDLTTTPVVEVSLSGCVHMGTFCRHGVSFATSWLCTHLFHWLWLSAQTNCQCVITGCKQYAHTCLCNVNVPVGAYYSLMTRIIDIPCVNFM